MKKKSPLLKNTLSKKNLPAFLQVERVVKPDYRYKFFPLLHIFSKLILLFAGILLLPALVSYLYDDGLIRTYTHSAAAVAILGCVIWVYTQKYQRELKPKDSILFVILIWVGFALFASLPFYLHLPNITFTDAFFEATSGLTTTGATILEAEVLDNLAPSLNFWRHLLNWLGGMGIIIIAIAILPLLGLGGAQMYKVEMPRMENNNKLAPRISKTAKGLWVIYCAFTVLCALSLKAAGMNWFDAWCHALSTLSLGGFSTYSDSVGHFNSAAIEMVMAIFMLIAAINFATHFAAIHNRKLSSYWQNQETKYAFTILFVSILAAAVYLWLNPKLDGQNNPITHYSLLESLRVVFFNFIAIGSTSGFMSENYFSQWPDPIMLWMLFLATFIASSGSTGGGIKMARAIILLKFSLREMTLLLHPNAVKTVKLNKQPVSERVAFSTLAFIFVYIITIITFSFILMLSNLDYFSSFSAALSCLTNVGTGLGIIDDQHNFATLTAFQKWVCMLAMLMGRMEIFTILILLTPGFWRK